MHPVTDAAADASAPRDTPPAPLAPTGLLDLAALAVRHASALRLALAADAEEMQQTGVICAEHLTQAQRYVTALTEAAHFAATADLLGSTAETVIRENTGADETKIATGQDTAQTPQTAQTAQTYQRWQTFLRTPAMESVNMHEAKTNLSKLAERVEHGESIVLCRSGKPAAMLVPIREP